MAVEDVPEQPYRTVKVADVVLDQVKAARGP
jgi:hypothetical protein